MGEVLLVPSSESKGRRSTNAIVAGTNYGHRANRHHQHCSAAVLEDISAPVDNLSLLGTPRVTYGGLKRL
jgi:hypothetical protein